MSDMTEEKARETLETLKYDFSSYGNDDIRLINRLRYVEAQGFLQGIKIGETKEREKSKGLLEGLKTSKRSLKANISNFRQETKQIG